MTRVVRTYRTDHVEVTWAPSLCIHTGICMRELPEVFDTGELPWVQVEGAEADAVMQAVAMCPTGALAARPLPEGANPYEPSGPLEFRPHDAGPLYVRGDIELTDPETGEVVRCSRVALCTCGRTEDAPFCDDRHRKKVKADVEAGPSKEALDDAAG